MGGITFEVGPEDALTVEERSTVDRFRADVHRRLGRAFRLRLVGVPSWEAAPLATYPDHCPASVAAVHGRLHVAHKRFAAEIDPFAGEGRYFRPAPTTAGIEATLRVVLQSTLPLDGGVALHAAGVVVRGAGVAFFGPSGAGKSTLSAASPHPVLSDELVVARVGPPTLQASGIWGTLERRPVPGAPVPLAALVELDRGPECLLERLTPQAALRRLIGVSLVPALPALWRPALHVLGHLVHDVPAYRMKWNPAASPWPSIESCLTDDGACRDAEMGVREP